MKDLTQNSVCGYATICVGHLHCWALYVMQNMKTITATATIAVIMMTCGTAFSELHSRIGSSGSDRSIHIEKFDDKLKKVVEDTFIFKRHIISIQVVPEQEVAASVS